MELSTFMSIVMDALIHHHSHEELEVSSAVNPPATVSMNGNHVYHPMLLPPTHHTLSTTVMLSTLHPPGFYKN